MSLIIPNTFATLSGSVQLSLLDDNFNAIVDYFGGTGGGVSLTGDLSVSGKTGIGLTPTVAQLEVLTPTLGTVVNNSVDYLRLINTNANTSFLRFYQYRNSNGSSWDTTSTRIQQRIDVTDMAYLEFNPPSGTYGLALGTENTERLRITREGALSLGSSGSNTGNAGNILQSNGSGSSPSWVESGPRGLTGFVPCYFTASAVAGILTVSSITDTSSTGFQGYLQAGASTFTLSSVAGTASATQTGTTLSLSAVTGTVMPGAVITYPAFSGSITSSGSTLTVATATTGTLRSGNTIVLTTGAFTAVRAVTTGIVTVSGFTGSVPLAAGMAISAQTGYITAQLTGTPGGNGTYQSSATTAVASGSRTATTTLTVSGYGTGAGGTGTYTITSTNGTFTTFASTPATAGQTNAVTVTALGTGTGGTGNYTVNTSLTAAASSVTTSAAGSQLISINAGSGSSWEISPNGITFSSRALISRTYNFTVPAGVNGIKYYIAGAGGGGSGGGGGVWNQWFNSAVSGSSGGSGGAGGRTVGVATGLAPGQVISISVASKGLGTAGTAGQTANLNGNLFNIVPSSATSATGNSSFGSIYATSGTAGTVGGQVFAGGTIQAPVNGVDGTIGSGVGGTFNVTGPGDLVFWFKNFAGLGGNAGGGGYAQNSTKSQSAMYNNGSSGGDGYDGMVVLEY
jgi:hypothetical protein